MSNSFGADLQSLEHWMQEVILQGVGARKGLEHPGARHWIDVDEARLGEVVQPSATLTSLERLEVYAGMYVRRLVECLELDYPVVRRRLGEPRFQELARQFVREHPSSLLSLNDYGTEFASFLEQRQQPDGKFFGALATLERSVVEVYHERQADPLTPEDWQKLPAEAWSSIRLVLVPALRLFEFDFPVNQFLDQERAGDSPALPATKKSWVLVVRRGLHAQRRTLEEAPFRILHALQAGHALEQALEAGLEGDTLTVDELLARVPEWFQDWASMGVFWKTEDH